MGEGAIEPLRAIVLDETEDLNVRVYAIHTYTALVKEDAVKTLKQIRNDPDAEIRDLVANILTDFKSSK